MIRSTSNKVRESRKDNFMSSQTAPVSGRRMINTTVNLFSKSQDSVTKNIYKSKPKTGDFIKDTQGERLGD